MRRLLKGEALVSAGEDFEVERSRPHPVVTRFFDEDQLAPKSRLGLEELLSGPPTQRYAPISRSTGPSISGQTLSLAFARGAANSKSRWGEKYHTAPAGRCPSELFSLSAKGHGPD
jgi:hypothetical protein